MFDRELVLADLNNIVWAMAQIQKRCATIVTPGCFTKDDAGLEKLDSICMQLINIGETLKHIDKLTYGKLLSKYPEIDWKKAKGLRDIITHHYFDIDPETIFAVCWDHIPPIEQTLKTIIADLEVEN